MKNKDTTPLWVVPLIIILFPLVVVLCIFWLLYHVALYLLVWTCWLTQGKDILFVYSDSPHWHDYIESEILPRIKDRAVVLNWSERRNWIQSFSLGAAVFRYFGGRREFNPLGLYFHPFSRCKTYRFWQPIRDWKKKGNRKELDELLLRFFTETKA